MPHDRDELFALVEQLIDLEMREDRHPRTRQRGTSPVVLALGRRGSGKTAALAEISDAYRNRAPQARADLAAERYDKAMPIVQYSPSGVPQPAVDPIFLNGTPTTADCQITQGG